MAVQTSSEAAGGAIAQPHSHSVPSATTTQPGTMSASDKAKLDSIPAGGGGETLAILPSPNTAYTTNFSATVGYHYRINTVAGDVTVTVEQPSVANAGEIVEFKQTAVSTHNMILACSALIDGAASISIASGSLGLLNSITLRSTGAGGTWDVI